MGNVTRNENGRVTSVYGLPVRIESVAGSYRIKSGRPPILVSDDYGELVGTKGADQDPIDCYVGPYPETNTVYVINQDKQGVGFDEHKVMFGFLDQDHAINVYSLGCFGKKPMSVVACTVSQFKWWLEYGNHTEAMTAQSLPFDSYSETAMQQIPEYDWDQPTAAASRVLYDMRVMDSAYGQLIEANNHRDLLDQIEHQDGGELGVLDALVIPNNQIQKKAAQIGMALNRAAGDDIKVVEEGGVEVTEPYRQGGTTNIAMLFSMSDGQTVSVFFHNPDVTPNKLSPDDSMVSWKWMLNKKDITIVVAKENGQDQSISAIAKKIMALVEANATKFARANAKAAENEAEIKATEERIEQKKNVLQSLLDQIAALESGSSVVVVEPKPQQVPNGVEPSEMNIDLLNTDIHAFMNAGEADLYDAVQRYMRENFQGRYVKTVIGDVLFTSVATREMRLGTDKDRFRAAIIPFVPNTLKNGDYLGREGVKKDRKDSFVAFHRFKGEAVIGSYTVTHIVTVAERENAKFEFLAYHNKLKGAEPKLDTGSNNSVLDALGNNLVGRSLLGQTPMNSNVAAFDSAVNDSGWNIEIVSVIDSNGEHVANLEDVVNSQPEPALEPEPVLNSQLEPVQFVGNELGDFDLSTDEGKKAMRAAARTHLESLRGKWVDCPAMPRDENGDVRKVEIRNRSVKEFISYTGNPVKILLAAKIEEIIETARNAVVEPNFKLAAKPGTFEYYKLENTISVDGMLHQVVVMIERDIHGYLHYDLMLPNKVKATLDSVALQPEPFPTTKAGVSSMINTATFDDVSQQDDGSLLNLFVKVQNADGEWVELEDTFEPEETDESGHDTDRAFLQEVIEGLVDVMDEGFHERMTAVALRYNGGDNTEMQTMVEQAVNAYTAKLDELSQ
ncbi:hypothetical protein [Vitreoscilla stercoraria]|uniref:Uncharacterized protein n=1 Tax=Vitreoscilla stercoraria TaxID=61 RepID=A0ABY4EDL0_VITST|nr:hypothetical protein [Vitreoscilla stercoraria]UOO93381.1 hypothetical protein LVJ81_04960 [Vitreoscilla stercoraria]